MYAPMFFILEYYPSFVRSIVSRSFLSFHFFPVSSVIFFCPINSFQLHGLCFKFFFFFPTFSNVCKRKQRTHAVGTLRNCVCKVKKSVPFFQEELWKIIYFQFWDNKILTFKFQFNSMSGCWVLGCDIRTLLNKQTNSTNLYYIEY